MVTAIVIAALVFINALCVAAEFAVIATREGRIRTAADDGDRSARRLLGVLRDPLRLDRYISSCQLGITVTSLVLGAYSEFALAGALTSLFEVQGYFEVGVAHSVAVVAVLVGVTMLQVVLGEQVPKSLALHSADRVALLTVWPMTIWQRVIGFCITFLTWASRGVLRLLGTRAEVHRHVHSRQEIDLMMEESLEMGAIESDQHERLQHVLYLDTVTARQLMVPRPEIFAVDIDSDEDDSMQLILDGRYTRVPVYKALIDEVVGVIHTKDLARHAVEKGCIKDWRKLIRPISFVNEGMTADRLLALLREKRTQQAIVMDEFGGVAGLVTLEDVLTHVFGEVMDEFSEAIDNPQRLPDGSVRLPGRLRLDECEEWVGAVWEGSSTTVSGLVTERLGHLPRPGMTMLIEGVEVVVEGVVKHVVTSVVAKPLEDLRRSGNGGRPNGAGPSGADPSGTAPAKVTDGDREAS